jgi:hypothetical protein
VSKIFTAGSPGRVLNEDINLSFTLTGIDAPEFVTSSGAGVPVSSQVDDEVFTNSMIRFACPEP